MDNENQQRQNEDLIVGRNAVGEALRAGREIDHVLTARGERSGSLGALLARCRKQGVPVKEVDVRKLDAMCGPQHQGIAAVAACKGYVTLDDLFDAAQVKGEPPFIVVCDELEDPHNLGAVMRTAEAVGAHLKLTAGFLARHIHDRYTEVGAKLHEER